MGEEIKQMEIAAEKIKSAMLKNNNVDILLYLAKYNPKVTLREIEDKFGKSSADGLKTLIGAGLVLEEGGSLSLTNTGIFQIDGLLALV